MTFVYFNIVVSLVTIITKKKLPEHHQLTKMMSMMSYGEDEGNERSHEWYASPSDAGLRMATEKASKYLI